MSDLQTMTSIIQVEMLRQAIEDVIEEASGTGDIQLGIPFNLISNLDSELFEAIAEEYGICFLNLGMAHTTNSLLIRLESALTSE